MAVLTVLFISCGLREKMGQYETEERNMISKEFWGTWIRMDTGDEYYIDSISVWKSSSYSKKNTRVSYGLRGLALDYASDDVMVGPDSKIYFRKGGSARSFTATLSGFSEIKTNASIADGTRAASGVTGVTVNRRNVNNAGDAETVTSASDGSISFGKISTGTSSGSGAVAGDEQKITVEGTSTKEIGVTPAYDGENIGSIPIIPKDMYGFKTTYTINGDDQGYIFAGKEYTLNLSVTNVGDKDCEAFGYKVYCDNPALTISDTSKSKAEGIYRTLEPEKSMHLELKVSYTSSTKASAYEDIPLCIDITEPTSGVWKDSVTLRFYSGYVPFVVKAAPATGVSSATLNGFIIYPDGRSKRFTVSSRGSTSKTSLEIPWSDKDYLIAFSGASADSEMTYSFALGNVEPDNLTEIGIADLQAYEPNDSVGQARTVDVSKSVKAYLKKNDIDFYRINVSQIAAN